PVRTPHTRVPARAPEAPEAEGAQTMRAPTLEQPRSAGTPAPEHPPVGRRTLLTGTGAGLTALALAACTADSGADDPATQYPEPDDDPAPGAGGEVSVVFSEDPGARGEWPVWSVGYELADGQEAPALFDATTQALRHEALEAKKSERQWSAADPLLV